MTISGPNFKEAIHAYIETDLLRGRAVNADEDLLLTGLIDSLSVMNLVSEVERLSGLSVTAADVTIENFVSVDAIAAYVDQKRGAV